MSSVVVKISPIGTRTRTISLSSRGSAKGLKLGGGQSVKIIKNVL